MQAKYFSEMSVDYQLTKRRYITEDGTLHNHRCENLKSYMDNLVIMQQRKQPKFVEIAFKNAVPTSQKRKCGHII
jgi:hypothetical protein